MIRRGHNCWLIKHDSWLFVLLITLRVPMESARVGTDCVTWTRIKQR